MRQWISWATSAGTLLGMWAVGRRYWWGWAIGLANQVLWVTMSVMFQTWGLLPLTAALVVLYVKNLVAWRRLNAQEALT